MNYGLKISLPGKDVKTATLQELGFSSKYPLLKAKFAGSLNFTITAASVAGTYVTSSVSFNHALGYLPAFRVYGQNNTTSGRRIPLDFYSFFGLSYAVNIRARIDNANLVIWADNANTSSISIVLYYYIYADPAT